MKKAYKWCFELGEMFPKEIPEHSSLYDSNPLKPVQCASCGYSTIMARAYRSFEIQDKSGEFYMICMDCHDEEIEEMKKRTKKEKEEECMELDFEQISDRFRRWFTWRDLSPDCPEKEQEIKKWRMKQEKDD